MKYIIGIIVAGFLCATSTFGQNITLDFYHLFPVEAGTAEGKVLRDAVDSFEKDNSDVKVNWIADPSDAWYTKIKAMLASGQLPDVFATQPSDFQQFKDSGMFLNLDAALAEDANWKDSFATSALNTIYNDGVYGVPYSSYIEGVFYNQKLFEQHGLEYPKTWDELLNVVDTFVESGIIPFAQGGKDGWIVTIQTHYLMDREKGFDYFMDSLTDRSKTWNNPEYIRAFDRLAELASRGAFDENTLANGYGDGESLFLTEKAAMYLMGTWAIGSVTNPDLGDFGNNIHFENYVEIPGGLGDQSSITRGYGKSFAIRSDLPEAKQKAAIELLKYITNRKVGLALLEEGGLLSGNNPPEGVKADIPRLLSEAIVISDRADTTWAAYGEYFMPGFYDEVNRTSQRLIAGTIDGKTAAEYLEEKRLKFHFE